MTTDPDTILPWYCGKIARIGAALCGTAGLALLAIPILANLLNPMVWWDAPIGVGIGIGFLALLLFGIFGRRWLLWFAAPTLLIVVGSVLWGIASGEMFG